VVRQQVASVAAARLFRIDGVPRGSGHPYPPDAEGRPGSFRSVDLNPEREVTPLQGAIERFHISQKLTDQPVLLGVWFEPDFLAARTLSDASAEATGFQGQFSPTLYTFQFNPEDILGLDEEMVSVVIV